MWLRSEWHMVTKIISISLVAIVDTEAEKANENTHNLNQFFMVWIVIWLIKKGLGHTKLCRQLKEKWDQITST